MNSLKDPFLRVIDYLRISITDRCNLRCLYCMPADGVLSSGHDEILRYEEIIRVVRIAAGLGVRKVRLTGGEPLTRKNITFLIRSLREIEGIEDLSLTTNGILLARYAQELADAGLSRVNVSIDSFDPERYHQITRGGDLGTVLAGLEAAEKAGLRPLKINMVPMRGVNDDEVTAFARMTLTSDYHVRFIECMPSGGSDFWGPEKYITTDELMRTIGTLGPLEPVRARKNGPSKYYRLKDARGVLGFISALTHHFCRNCNRLRLTADGKLRPCLFSETEIDLRAPMRSGASDAEVERLLRLAVEVKPEGHAIGNRKPCGEGQAADPAAESGTAEGGRPALDRGNGQGAEQAGRKRPMSKIGG